MARRRRLGAFLGYEDLWRITNTAESECRKMSGKKKADSVCVVAFTRGAVALFNWHREKERR